MSTQTFRGDPYRVLDVAHDASNSSIKRRWRELAREHHPDRAAGDAGEAARLTARMARINAAYDLLSDPLRRATYDQSAEGRAARHAAASAPLDESAERPVGPPPPPPSPPVTARFDTSTCFRPRNATVGGRRHHPPGHEPTARRPAGEEPLRASTPSGPVRRQAGEGPARQPSLREALDTELAFGKFRGYTLGEVALVEPTYIDWIARTITRDRELVAMARVVQGEIDRSGVARRMRPSTPFHGSRSSSGS